jgi:hypothetical protein
MRDSGATGFFMLPRIDEPLAQDIGAVVLHLRYVRGAETLSDGLQFNLHVRQQVIRDYDARLNAP